MPINAHPEYIAAEGEYLKAQTLEEKIEKLKKMISLAPAHKGAENLRAQLKTRLKKFLGEFEKSKKSGPKRSGIKKAELQAVIIGNTNVGKSSLLNLLTNVNTRVSEVKFTTKNPIVGIMFFSGIQIQIIEIPASESEFFDKGLTHTADTVIILVNDLSQIEPLLKKVESSPAKKLIIFNLFDNKNERKIEATLKSKRYDFCIVNTKTKEHLDKLKERLFLSFKKIRIFTKEPGKEKSNNPLILEPHSTIKDVVKKVLSKQAIIKETRIWGPSSKFPGQIVGLNHQLKDMDIVEFKTR